MGSQQPRQAPPKKPADDHLTAKKPSSGLPIGIAIELSTGLILESETENLPVGLFLGEAIGPSLGIALNSAISKK